MFESVDRVLVSKSGYAGLSPTVSNSFFYTIGVGHWHKVLYLLAGFPDDPVENGNSVRFTGLTSLLW